MIRIEMVCMEMIRVCMEMIRVETTIDLVLVTEIEEGGEAMKVGAGVEMGTQIEIEIEIDAIAGVEAEVGVGVGIEVGLCVLDRKQGQVL